MRILAVDTALGACSVAIALDGEVVARAFKPLSRGHAEVLFAMISEVEQEAGLRASDMDRFAVTIGPGTFTGLRVGLSAARGLGLATSKPVLGLTTLQALAAGVAAKDLTSEDVITSVIDAKRGECYMQMFDPALMPLSVPMIVQLDAAAAALGEALQKAGGRAFLVGTGAMLIAERLGQVTHPTQVHLTQVHLTQIHLTGAPDQPDAGRLALLAAAIDDVASAPARPLYLRAPDAKLPQSKPLFAQPVSK